MEVELQSLQIGPWKERCILKTLPLIKDGKKIRFNFPPDKETTPLPFGTVVWSYILSKVLNEVKWCG